MGFISFWDLIPIKIGIIVAFLLILHSYIFFYDNFLLKKLIFIIINYFLDYFKVWWYIEININKRNVEINISSINKLIKNSINIFVRIIY